MSIHITIFLHFYLQYIFTCSICIKNFCASKDTIRKVKNNLQNKREYLEITSLIRV